MSIPIEQIADDMYKLVSDAAGKKKLKPGDLTKSLIKKYGEEVSKKDCKVALKTLIDGGKCIYGYFGGSSVELPHKEGSEN